jgi:hypothetical protein
MALALRPFGQLFHHKILFLKVKKYKSHKSHKGISKLSTRY